MDKLSHTVTFNASPKPTIKARILIKSISMSSSATPPPPPTVADFRLKTADEKLPSLQLPP